MANKNTFAAQAPLSNEEFHSGVQLMQSRDGELPSLENVRLLKRVVARILGSKTASESYNVHSEYYNWLTMVHKSGGNIQWVRDCCYEEPKDCPCQSCQDDIRKFENQNRVRRVNEKSKPMRSFVYLMKNNRNGLVKIGYSIDPKFREKTLQSEEPEVELVASWLGDFEAEQVLHKRFAVFRVRGEWFRLSDTDVAGLIGEKVEVCG